VVALRGQNENSLNIYRFRMEGEDRQTQEQPVFAGPRYGRITIRR